MENVKVFLLFIIYQRHLQSGVILDFISAFAQTFGAYMLLVLADSRPDRALGYFYGCTATHQRLPRRISKPILMIIYGECNFICQLVAKVNATFRTFVVIASSTEMCRNYPDISKLMSQHRD